MYCATLTERAIIACPLWPSRSHKRTSSHPMSLRNHEVWFSSASDTCRFESVESSLFPVLLRLLLRVLLSPEERLCLKLMALLMRPSSPEVKCNWPWPES